jgi:lipopolysaccharide transport system permease protein
MQDKRMYEVIIEPGSVNRRYLTDIWRFRELLLFLAWRDILVRYKQTVFGIVWAFLRPLVTMLAFTFVFGRLAKMPSPDQVSYSLMVLVGTVAWQLFASIITLSSQSLIIDKAMISKIYFPRIIIPLSASSSPLIDFAVSLIFVAFMMFFSGSTVTYSILLFPVFLILTLITAIGIGTWLGALNVRYRDFREVTPFLIQFGIFISPVGYVSDVVPENLRLLYSLNPVVGIIDGFRWCFLGADIDLYLPGFFVSMASASIILILGVSYFRKTERTFADVI